MAKSFRPEAAEREADRIGEKFMHSNNVMQDMSRAYGADFSDIKIHTDDAADRRVKAAGKDALAAGNDLFFGKGIFESRDPASQGLVAHELAHTMQQGVSVGEGAVSEWAPEGTEQGGVIIDWFKRTFGRPENKVNFAANQADTAAGKGKSIGGFWRGGNTFNKSEPYFDPKRANLHTKLFEHFRGGKYGDGLSTNIQSPDGSTYIKGLGLTRLMPLLQSQTGEGMSEEDVIGLYEKLLAGGRYSELRRMKQTDEVKQEMASYTPEQLSAANTQFDEGIIQLKGIYLAQLRRIRDQYGTYITQMHPEDFLSKVGGEFFSQMGCLQDAEQLMLYGAKYFDFTGNEEDREFKQLSDYYNDAYAYLNLYVTTDSDNDPETGGKVFTPNEMMLDYVDEAEYGARARQNEANIQGPGFSANEQRGYENRVKKRFGKGNLLKRLVGRFRS